MTRLLSVKEVSERLGCSIWHTYRLAESRQIAFVRVGRTALRIPEAAVEEFLRERLVPAEREPSLAAAR